MSKHADVIVVGGGIIGLTSALFLARNGLQVEVLDRGDLGKEASWAGAGIIPPGDPVRATSPIDQLRSIGSKQFPELSAQLREITGIDNGYRRCGGIEFLDPSDTDILEHWELEGIVVERVDRKTLHERLPRLGEVEGEAYYLPDYAQVRNPWHIRALIAASSIARVTLRPFEPVNELLIEGTRFLGVRTPSGTINGGAVLITSGSWSDGLLAQLGIDAGVHPVRGQIVLYACPRVEFESILLFGKEYMVPRDDGRVLIGSTEEPEAGFVKENTASAIAKLRSLAERAIPVLKDRIVEKCWSGLRPGSRDGLPLLGRVPGCENAFVATGHFRAGVQLSIGTAKVIAEVMCGKPPSVPLDSFRPDRIPGSPKRPTFRS